MAGGECAGSKAPTLVQILRSDGSIQNAFLRSVQTEHNSVTVMWHENNRNRIKVLSIDALLKLNPSLIYYKGHFYTHCSDETCPRGLSEFINKEYSKRVCQDYPFSGGSEFDATVPGPDASLSSARRSADDSLHTSYSASCFSITGKNCNSSTHLTTLSGRSTKTDFTDANSLHSDPHRSSIKIEKPLGRHSRITVCVRKRPLNIQEKASGDIEIVDTSTPGLIVVSEPRYRVDFVEFVEKQSFRFDCTFDQHTTTKEVYDKTAAPLLRSIFQGAMATCFAYGQTGSGKTYTMSGPPDMQVGYPVFSEGLQGMVVSDLFKQLAASNLTATYCITVAFF
uniref:Kinesin-like protein KIF2C n=1 Tax=Schistocephalus solidus TaxID=70667 RepID=A0A0X3P9T8_SCHSO